VRGEAPSVIGPVPLAVGLLLAAAEDGHGRLSLSLGAGGGWASEAFLGAVSGSEALAQVSSGVRLDVSLAPEVKLAAAGEATWGRYLDSEFTASSGSGEVEARLLLDGLELGLGAAGERAAFSAPAPLDPGLVATPDVTATRGGAATIFARRRGQGVDLRLGISGSLRTSRWNGIDVSQREAAASAILSWFVHPRFTASAGVRALLVEADRLEFDLRGGSAALGMALRPLGDLQAELQGQVERARVAGGFGESAQRVHAEISHPVGEGATALFSWSWTRGSATRPDLASVERQQIFLGLRARMRTDLW
jgi:hypothetical protein